MDGEILQPKTVQKRRKNSKLQDLKRQEVGGKRLLVSRFRLLLDTMGKRPTVVRDIVYTRVVRTHLDGADRAPNPGYGGAALQKTMRPVCLMRTTRIF